MYYWASPESHLRLIKNKSSSLSNHLIFPFSHEKQHRFLYVVNLQNPILNMIEQYARLKVSLHIDCASVVVGIVVGKVVGLRVVRTVVFTILVDILLRTVGPFLRKCFVNGAAITVSAAAKASVLLFLAFSFSEKAETSPDPEFWFSYSTLKWLASTPSLTLYESVTSSFLAVITDAFKSTCFVGNAVSPSSIEFSHGRTWHITAEFGLFSTWHPRPN